MSFTERDVLKHYHRVKGMDIQNLSTRLAAERANEIAFEQLRKMQRQESAVSFVSIGNRRIQIGGVSRDELIEREREEERRHLEMSSISAAERRHRRMAMRSGGAGRVAREIDAAGEDARGFMITAAR